MLTVSPESSLSYTKRKFQETGPTSVALVTALKAGISSWSAYSALSFEGLCYSVGIGCPLAIGALFLLPEDVLEITFAVTNLATPYFAAPAVALKTAIFTANMVIFKNVIKIATPDL